MKTDLSTYCPSLSRRAVAGYLLGAAVVGFGCGCGSSRGAGKAPPDRAAIEKAFQAPAVQPAATGTHDLDVYIDGSESMRGYTVAAGSRFPTVVRHVLEHAAAARYRVSRYKFTSTITSVDSLRTNEILADSFYNGADSPLSRLLERVAENPSKVSVIISDLVQSDIGRDETDLVKALSRLSEKHMELRLLGFRSNFDGEYFPENRPGGVHVGKYRLKKSEGLPNTGRPFYVFVAAPDRASLDLLQNYILQSAHAPQTFSPTDAAMAIEKVDFVSPPAAEAVWNPFAKAAMVPMGSGSIRHFGSFREFKTPREKESLLRLQLTGEMRTGIEAYQRVKLRVRRAKYQDGRFVEAPADADVTTVVEPSASPKTGLIQVAYSLRRPDLHSWDVYEFRMTAGDGNLKVPEWVKNWSTDADELAENGNRTFQLSLLVESMLRNITEKNVFCEQYIAVGRN